MTLSAELLAEIKAMAWNGGYTEFTLMLRDLLAAYEAATAWQDISTAPKDGTEVWVWRHDGGAFLARFVAPQGFMTDAELEKLSEEEAETADWFYADFIQGGRLELDCAPTLWQSLPAPPQETKP